MKDNLKQNDVRTKIKKRMPLIFIHIFLLSMIVSNISMSRTMSVMEKFGSDWPEVQVTIDDVSFEYDYSEREDDGDKIYYFELTRILHYTYNGVEYEVKDIEEHHSRDKDYDIELRQAYTDQYTYQINPEQPTSIRKSYSMFSDSNASEIMDKIEIAIPVIILVIMDAVIVMKSIRNKKKIFDEA